SVDIWAWIIGGIIAGLLIFVIAYSHMMQTTQSMAEQKSLEQFTELSNMADELCRDFTGNTKELNNIILTENIKGIYATDDNYAELNNTELINKIVDEEISSGKYICIKIEDRKLNCKLLKCESKMPYIGAVPTEFSLSALVNKVAGNYEKFNYDLKLKRLSTIVEITKKTDEKETPANHECNLDFMCTAEECLIDCEDCYGPDILCTWDVTCNPFIGETCANSPECDCKLVNPEFVCCIENPNSDERGCTAGGLSKREECFCADECATDLMCNPTTSDFTDYKKACCPLGKSWDGTDCVFGADVLIVALNTTLQSVYSSAQITTLENKIKDYQLALGKDGLGSIFLYLDEDKTSNIIGSKVTKPNNWNNIDGILDQLIPKLNASYIVIIGGYNRFVQPHAGSNACGYGLPYESDNPYGDYSPKDNILDIPVGRFPDPNNGDLNVILNALDTSITLHNAGGVDLSSYIAPIMSCGGYDNRRWTSGRCFCSAVWGASCSACGSCCGCIKHTSASGKDFVTVLAHGPGPASCDMLLGGCFNIGDGTCSCKGYDRVFGPNDIAGTDVSDSLWMSMACGGGHMRLKSSTSGSIVMTFLRNRGAIYFGSTSCNRGTLGSGCPVPGGDRLIGTMYTLVVKEFKINAGTGVGNRIGDFYMKGKNNYKRS
ncbi:MAG: hypothetical protein KAU95_01490, partial [Candidatus Aenigmarchaeota archaeon]|nr:hypothetical protein [Candidatus Aenigmarchaeota archaeon]